MSEVAVLIVGAGPTGLSLAIECCRYDVPFRLIEVLPEPSPYSKALAIWQGSQQVFAAQGCLDAFLKVAMPLPYVEFTYLDKVLTRFNLSEGVGELQGGPLLLAQSETEHILTQHLKKLGGKIERGVELVSLESHKDFVSCELKKVNGHTETVHATYLAACDGARSVVRKYLEEKKVLRFKGYTEAQTFLLGDFEFEGDYKDDHIKLSFSNSDTLAFFPVSKKFLRMITLSKGNEELTLELFAKKLKTHGVTNIKLSKATWLSPFKINERMATRLVYGRMLLLGDAAHIHSPAGGQGMNTGIQDAFNVGWKLAWALKSPKDAKRILQTYHDERYPVLEKIVHGAAQKLHFGMAHGPIMTALKRILLPIIGKLSFIRRRLSKELSELYFYYAHSMLINDRPWPQKHQGIVSGMKIFDVVLHDAKQNVTSLFAHALHNSHVLIIFKCDKNIHLDTVKALLPFCKIVVIHRDQMSDDLDPDVVHLLDISGTAHLIYGANKPCWYLVRPDLFIARRGLYKNLRAIPNYFMLK